MSEALAMTNDSSNLVPNPGLTDGYKGVEFSQKEERDAFVQKGGKQHPTVEP